LGSFALLGSLAIMRSETGSGILMDAMRRLRLFVLLSLLAESFAIAQTPVKDPEVSLKLVE
jgi:hypothetical protein